MTKAEINIDRLANYRAVTAKLAIIDPSTQEFEDLQKESESLWASLTVEEKAVAHEEHTTPI